MSNKTCLDCEHCYVSPGDPGYSEYTPGFDADMYCGKSHWKYDAYNDGRKELRDKFYMALTCPDFVPVQENEA